MKQQNHSILFLFLASLALSVYGCATGAATNAALGSGPAVDLANMLSGTYELQGENTNLRLDISSTGAESGPLNLLATASGTWQGRAISEQGVISLTTAGPDVMMSVIPHFGEPVTQLSPDVNQFSSTEIQAACSLHLQAYDGGWAGATRGTGTCIRAIPQALGRWQVNVQPGTLSFSEPDGGQAVVFREVSEPRGR